MKKFILAGALALLGTAGFSGKADAQLMFPGYFPGGGLAYSGGYGFGYYPGFSLSFGSYSPYYGGYGYGYSPYYSGWGYGSRYYSGYGGRYYGGYRGGYHRGWRRW